MATANTALFRGFMFDDIIITANAQTTANVITKGDYVIGSGTAVVGGESSLGGAMLRASGLGIALANNPTWNAAGTCVVNSALLIARRGVFRVSAASATAQGDWPLGQPVVPVRTGSGIVGLTGATGMGSLWATAGIVEDTTGWSAARAYYSGVGQAIFLAKVGSTGQADIVLFPPGAIGYI